MTRLDPAAARTALARGEVLLLPTDTLPGLHGLASIESVGDRLARLKGHPPDRPYLLLVGSVEAALGLGRPASEAQAARLREVWPGPVTALLRPAADTPSHWVHERRSVAVRVPGHQTLLELLDGLSGPLFSTSANRAGDPPALDLDAARAVFGELDYVELPGASGETPRASTIVDCTVDPAVVVRAGTIAF